MGQLPELLHRPLLVDLVSFLHSDSLLFFLAEKTTAIIMTAVESRYFLRINGHPPPAAVLGLPNQAELDSVEWNTHGDLIVTTTTSILRMSPDSSRQVTLLSDPSETIVSSSVCGRGGPILFGAYLREGKTSYNIWRVDADGSHPKQLTSGKQEALPLCSPDGGSFYYFDFVASRIMKMPINGGVSGTHQGQRSPHRIHARRGELFARRQVDAGDRGD